MTTGITSTQIPFAKAYDDEPEYLYSTMVFQQSYAPVGWKKITTSIADSAMLRVVSGNNGTSTGGSYPLNTNWINTPTTIVSPITGQITDVHFTTIAEMPVHNHTVLYSNPGGYSTQAFGAPSLYAYPGKSETLININPILTPGTLTSLDGFNGTSSAGHYHFLNDIPITLTSPTNATFKFKFKYVDAIVATRYFRGFDE